MNVVLTGANRGIGLGLARGFAQRGSRVFAGVRRPDEATELAALHAHGVSLHHLDLCDQVSIESFASEVRGAVERVDLLIHNAAVDGTEPLEALTLDLLGRVFCANVFGAAVLTSELRGLLSRGSLIVAIASRQGSIALADGRRGFPYRMSKAALNMFVRQLALQLQADGIGVLALRPGRVRTQMTGFAGDLDVDESCEQLLRAIDAFTLEQTGQFLAVDGATTPW